MTKLLLIDSRVQDIEQIVRSLYFDVSYIVFDYDLDTFDDVFQKINSNMYYESIGLVQHNITYTHIERLEYYYDDIGNKIQVHYDNSLSCYVDNSHAIVPDNIPIKVDTTEVRKFKMLNSMNAGILQSNHPDYISSWTDFFSFLTRLKEVTSTFDLFACKIWNDYEWGRLIYYIKSTILYVRASSDNTGYDGDFVLESDDFSMIDYYFTKSILSYQYALLNEYTLSQSTSGTLPEANEQFMGVSDNGILSSFSWAGQACTSLNDGTTWTKESLTNGWWSATSANGLYTMLTGYFSGIYVYRNTNTAINASRTHTLNSSTLGEGYTCSISDSGQYAVYSAKSNGSIEYSNNYLQTWTSIRTGLGTSEYLVIISRDGTKIVMLRFNDTTINYYDLAANNYNTGGTWSSYSIGATSSRRFCMNRDASIIYMSIANSILKINNLFTSPSTSSISVSGTPYCIVCSSDGNIVAYTLSSTAAVYISINGGSSFQSYSIASAARTIGMNSNGSKIYGCHNTASIFVKFTYNTTSSLSLPNYNFSTPALSTNTYRTVTKPDFFVTNWNFVDASGQGSFAIANQSTYWGYNSIVSGSPQWLVIHRSFPQSFVSRNISFSTTGTYRLSLSTMLQLNAAYTDYYLNIMIGDVQSGNLILSGTDWQTITFDFFVVSGIYPLYFIVSTPTNADKSLYITNVAISFLFSSTKSNFSFIPTAPVISSSLTGNTVSISYNASSSNGGLSITNYKYSLNHNNFVNIGTTNPFTISGTTTGDEVILVAENSAGLSAFSNPVYLSLPTDSDIDLVYNTISVTRPGASQVALVAYAADYTVTGFIRYFNINGAWIALNLVSVSYSSNIAISNGVISNDGTRVVLVGYFESGECRIFYGNSSSIVANTSNVLTITQIDDDTSGFVYDSISLTNDGNIMVVAKINQFTSTGNICLSRWIGFNYGPLVATLDTTPRPISSVAVSSDGNRIVYAGRNDTVYWAVWNGFNYGNATQIPHSVSTSNLDPKTVLFLGGNTNIIAVKTENIANMKYSTWNGTNYSAFTSVTSTVANNTRMFISDSSYNIYSVGYSPEILSSTFSVTSGNVFAFDVSFNNTTYTLNTLYKGTSYVALLKAGNTDGESGTTYVSFTTLREPDTPTNMIFTGAGNTQLTFSFTPPSSIVTRYDVSAISQSQTVSVSFTPPLTSYQLTGLLGATDYYIFLYAVNTYGRSFPLVGSSATLLVPDSVTNFTSTSLSDTSIQLNYTPPIQSVTNYSLTYSNIFPDTFTNISFANSSTVLTSSNNVVEIDMTQPNNTRLAIFATLSGLRYSRIINNIWGTYSTPSVSFDISPVNTISTACAILSDASRLVCSFGSWTTTNNVIYFANPTNLYNGTSTSLSFTRILETTQRAYTAIALTSDGSRLVVAAYSGLIYFSTWNGTNYSAFTQTFESTSRQYTSICVSPDGNKIAYCAGTTIYWALWNGTNYTNGTQISGVMGTGITRKIRFLGYDSDFIVLTSVSTTTHYYTTWNGTNYAALSTIPTAALPASDGWGLFIDTSGNTGNIYLAPNANTNVYRSVISFNKISNKTTVSVSGASTTYTLTGLLKNTTYDLSFVTVNVYGSSSPALTTGSTTNSLDAVTFVSASTTNTTSTVSFCAPIQTVTAYISTIDASGFLYTKTHSAPSITFVGLVPNKTYTYTVYGYNTDGSSSIVTSSFTTPIIATSPYTPVLITKSPYSIDVSFGLVEQSLPTIIFNGSAQVVAPNTSDANFNTGTIECWFRTNANNPSAAGIIVKPSAYGIYLNNNVLSAYDWSASAWRSTGYTLNNNVWYHVAFTFQSGVTNGSNIYLNGDLISTFTYTTRLQTSVLYFGSGGGWQYYTGYISEVRIWNTVRTASQIMMYYNKKLPASETGLVGYFPMIENSGSVIYNALKTGGIPNFTLSNTSQWTTDTIDIIDLSNTSYTLTATPSVGSAIESSLTKLYGGVGGLTPNTAYTVTVRSSNVQGTSSETSGITVTTDNAILTTSEILAALSTNVLYASNLFSSNTLTVTTQSPTYRNGTYTISSSTTFGTAFEPFYAFLLSTSTAFTNAYWSSSTGGYNTTTGNYVGSQVTTNIAGSSDILGDWIQIQLPYRITLKSVGLLSRQSSFPTLVSRMPTNMAILGSNNGTNWNIVYTNTNASYSSTLSVVTSFTITGATTPYSYIRLIARSIGIGNDIVNIQQINYNGDIYSVATPTERPYPLLASFVDVSNISPVLYRSVNINNALYHYKLNGFTGDSFENRLYNYASGIGIVDASLINNPQFGVTSGYNELQLVSTSGQYALLPSFANTANGLTVSCWFRANASANFSRIFDFASGTDGANDIFVAIYNNDLCYRISGTTIYYTLTSLNINTNVYYHLVFIIGSQSGSTCTVTVYLNNVLRYTGTNIPYPAIMSRTLVFIGKSSYSSNATLNGGINNFCVWNRALTTTEVYTLFTSSITSSSYRVYGLSLNNRNTNVTTSTSASTAVSVSTSMTGLSYGHNYAFYATNITGTESSSSNILYLTIPGPAPTLALSSYTNTAATFTITPSTAYFIVSYTITLTITSTNQKIVQTFTANTITISTLTQNTAYSAVVVANTRTVASSASNTISFTTDGPPTTPTGFTVQTSYSNILTASFTKYTGTNNVPSTYFISGRSRTSDISSMALANFSTPITTAGTDHLSLAMSAPGATRLALLVGLTNIQFIRILNGTWGSVTTATVTGVTVVDFIACAITSDGQRAAIIHGTNLDNALVYFANTANLFNGTSTSLALTQTLNTTSRVFSSVALSRDGSRMVCSVRSDYLYYATWNGTNYSTFTEISSGVSTNTRRQYTSVYISNDSNYLLYTSQYSIYWRVWNGTSYANERYVNMASYGSDIYNASFLGDNSGVILFSHSSGAAYLYWDGSNYSGVTSISTLAIPSGVNRGFVVDTSSNIYLYAQNAANIRATSVSSITYAATPTFTKTLTASRFVDTTNILFYYKLDGTDYFDQYLFNYDLSPVIADASFSGNPSFGTTSGYKEIQLVAASSQHIRLPSITIGTDGFTLACWFRSNASGNGARIFDLSTTASSINNLIYLAIFSNLLTFGFWNSTGSDMTGYINISNTNVNTNTYNHVALVVGARSGTTCTINGYLNGSLVYTGTNISYPIVIARSINYIGRSNLSIPYLNGGVFDVFMWNRPISAAEVTNLYNNPNTDFTPITNFTGISNYKIYDLSVNATNVYGTSSIATTNYTFGALTGTRVTNTAYNVYRFTSSGAFTIPGAKTVHFVLVGGGGTGANTTSAYFNYNAAGGGGGGVRTQSITQPNTTTYYIDLGLGGEGTGFYPTGVVDGNPTRIYYGSFVLSINGGSGAPIRTSTTSAPGGTAGVSSLNISALSNFSVSGTPGAGSTVSTNPSNGFTVTIGGTSYSLSGGGGGAQNTSTGQNAFGGGFAATSGANPSSGGTNTGGGGGGQKTWTSSGAVRAGGGPGGSGVVLVFYT